MKKRGVKFDAEKEEGLLALKLTELMFFEKRKDVYIEIQNMDYHGLKLDIQNLPNEYLYYSHLGRADLIEFESWSEKRVKINK